MGIAKQKRYLAILGLIYAGIGIAFWQLNTRYASDQVQSVIRESTASLSSTNWAIDFYTLRTREAIAVLAQAIGGELLRLEDPSPEVANAAKLKVNRAFEQWIGQYPHFHNVSAIAPSGIELARVDRWQQQIIQSAGGELKSQQSEPSVQEALSSRPGRAVRSVTTLLEDSPFPEATNAIGSKVVIGLGNTPTPRVLLSATLDSQPITEFLISEGSNPPDHYLFVIRMDGVIAVGDDLYREYEYGAQRGMENSTAADQLPRLWEKLKELNGNGEYQNDNGLYVFRTMVAPDEENPSLEPQAAGEPKTQLPSSAIVVFHPSSTLVARNPFGGPMAWAGLLLTYVVTGLAAFGFWRQRQQAQMLQAVTDAQSHALGVVKYELHTPAAAIDMMIDSGDRGAERWNQLASASKHLLAIIDDLRLSIAPERSVGERESPISIRQLTLEVDRQLTPLLGNRGQLLRYELPDWSDELFSGKYFLFRVIITNLIRYAAAQSNGHQVWLHFDRTEVSSDRDHIAILIDTDGEPLSDEEIERLFLPFDDTGRLGPIAGISLHMIQQWMRELGGEVALGPSEHGGVAFKLAIELDRVPDGTLREAEARHQSGAHHALAGHSILLAEDDPLLGPLVEEVLASQFGLTVVRAGSGEEALKELERRRFDMLLVDYYMPGMDGLKFIKAVRRSDAAVPIIGMCGGEDEYTQSQFSAAGADYVLVKPITRSRFDEAMSSLESAGRLKFQQKFPT